MNTQVTTESQPDTMTLVIPNVEMCYAQVCRQKSSAILLGTAEELTVYGFNFQDERPQRQNLVWCVEFVKSEKEADSCMRMVF